MTSSLDGDAPVASVIIPMDRSGADAERSLRSVLQQSTKFAFEVLVVVPGEVALPPDRRLRRIIVADRNPALRRNSAALEARGEILAFVDDDAFPETDWLETAVGYLEANRDVALLGGGDPGPTGASIGEQISDTLLATPLVGSGIMAHEHPPGISPIRSAHELALVNLFVRKKAFEDAGGFDTRIGYIGEDTDLIGKVLQGGRAVYHGGVVVRHRRRAFPGPYLRQRWRYRVKTGRLLMRGTGGYRSNWKILAFLLTGGGFLVLMAVAPLLAAAMFLLYLAIAFFLAVPRTTLPPRFWPFLLVAFPLHHLTYFAGMLTGFFLEALEGLDANP